MNRNQRNFVILHRDSHRITVTMNLTTLKINALNLFVTNWGFLENWKSTASFYQR